MDTWLGGEPPRVDRREAVPPLWLASGGGLCRGQGRGILGSPPLRSSLYSFSCILAIYPWQLLLTLSGRIHLDARKWGGGSRWSHKFRPPGRKPKLLSSLLHDTMIFLYQ